MKNFLIIKTMIVTTMEIYDAKGTNENEAFNNIPEKPIASGITREIKSNVIEKTY